MPTYSTFQNSEQIPITFLDRWIRLSHNISNIYLVKHINKNTLAFSLSTGEPNYVAVTTESLLGTYKLDSIPKIPASYSKLDNLKPGDIACSANCMSEWYLVGLYGTTLYKLFVEYQGVSKFTNKDKDTFVLTRTRLNFKGDK